MNRSEPILQILNNFNLQGTINSIELYGSGHVNKTYKVTTTKSSYILQKINSTAFLDVPLLMRNFSYVTQWLHSKNTNPRSTLEVVLTKDNKPYTTDENGDYWRVLSCVTDTFCLDSVRSPSDLCNAGVAFGTFALNLSDFPIDKLGETIVDFHNTEKRIANLRKAIDADTCNRASLVKNEIAFVDERANEACTLVHMLENNELPLRITHNDTKLNNILFDNTTELPLCVVDLDTVMPGLIGYDFGDAIRYAANSAAEDEIDLSKVKLSIPLYEAYCEGFISVCRDFLTEKELQTLPLAAKIITLETGVRFLTDYLQGDVYFSTHRPNHNLDRCRAQFALVADMERKFDEMQLIATRYYAK